MPNDPIILLTRPEPGATRFATQLRAAVPRVRVVTAPVMAIRFLDPDVDPAAGDLLVLTSSNGVDAAARLSGVQGMPALCVGQATTARAGDSGFSAQFGGADMAGLAATLRQKPPRRIVHVRGVHTSGDLAQAMHGTGHTITSVIAYDQQTLPVPDALTQTLAGADPVILPVFSARTWRIIAHAMDATPPACPLIGLGYVSFTHQMIESGRFSDVVTVTPPDSEAMIQALRATLL